MQLEFNQFTESNQEETLFIEAILPLAVDGTFTYRVPRLLNTEVAVGKRVTVHFGKRHIYTGVIKELHHRVPTTYKVKYLLEVLDEEPLVSVAQIKFWQWISNYYMCTLGEVMEAALPSYFKLKSETNVVLHPHYKDFNEVLSQHETLAIEALENEHEMSLSDLQDFLHIGNVMPIIRELHFKGIILTIEEIKQHYKPKTEKYLKLTDGFVDSETLTATFQILEEKKSTQKQSIILSTFLYLKKGQDSVKKSLLLKDDTSSISALNSLIKKGIFEEFEVSLDRWKLTVVDKKKYALNEFQEKAYKEIKSGVHQLKPVMFHGITGSGKTLVYLKLLERYIADGSKQALYLVPEIALTTQLLSRIASYFGDSIAVYHSRLNNSERYELWMGIKMGKYKLIVGVRSAIFLPFIDLRMIVVDEEHEVSFKQQDPAPRYNSRDAAIYLSHQLQIPIILGSATPSLESYHNAQIEKYHYVYLGKRFGDVKIPKIKLIDLREEQKANTMQGNISKALKNEIEKHLTLKNQVIIFQNRRGYAPVIECTTCGWVPYCKNCDVILTYHKFNQSLSCHYCGYSTNVPKKCNNCGQYNMRMKGTGTERIEDELAIAFPHKIIQRMDLDTTRKKNSLEDIIHSVEKGAIDILVGTQMVTKGLDFEKVKLVGVISGDSGLHHPDFRASERTFQMLVQVAGRAGRKGTQGEVCIQTYQPDNFIYQMLLSHNQKAFYISELQQRQLFKYPPYFRLIKVTVSQLKIEKVNLAADLLFKGLAKEIGPKRLLGPEFGSSPRLKNKYHKILHIKMENSPEVIQLAKRSLIKVIDNLKGNPKTKSVQYLIDVDPY